MSFTIVSSVTDLTLGVNEVVLTEDKGTPDLTPGKPIGLLLVLTYA